VALQYFCGYVKITWPVEWSWSRERKVVFKIWQYARTTEQREWLLRAMEES